jgi:hypothetical protein
VAIRDGFLGEMAMWNVEKREYKAAARQWYIERCELHAAYVSALNRRLGSGATERSAEEQALRDELQNLDRSGQGHVRALLGVLDSEGIGD